MPKMEILSILQHYFTTKRIARKEKQFYLVNLEKSKLLCLHRKKARMFASYNKEYIPKNTHFHGQCHIKYIGCLTPLGLFISVEVLCLIFCSCSGLLQYHSICFQILGQMKRNAGLVCLAADANYPKGFRAVDIPLITKATSDFVGLIGHSFSAVPILQHYGIESLQGLDVLLLDQDELMYTNFLLVFIRIALAVLFFPCCTLLALFFPFVVY
ncbi:hypothetical protein ACJX0J_023432 [Zea mays]